MLSCSTALAGSRIATEPVSVVDILVSGKATEHRLPQHPDQAVAAVLASARVGEHVTGHRAETEGLVEFTVGEQSGIGGDAGTVELQLETAVEIEPRSVRFRFTLWVRQDCPRSNEISY